MATQIKNYIFDASSKTITFSDYISVDKNSVALIVNIDDNAKTIAQFNKNGYSVLSVTNNVITLEYDTTLMSDSDELVIYYNDKDLPEEIPFKNVASRVFNKDKQYFYSLSVDSPTIIGPLDLDGFAGLTVSFRGAPTRSLYLQGSNDLTVWNNLQFITSNPTYFQNKDDFFTVPNINLGHELYIPKTTRYFRLNNVGSGIYGSVVVTLHHTQLNILDRPIKDTYEWNYVSPTGGITSVSGAVDLNSSGPGNTSRYSIKSIYLTCSSGTGTEVEIKNKVSSVLLWRGFVSSTQPLQNPITNRLLGDINNILTITVLTPSNTIYATIQGQKILN